MGQPRQEMETKWVSVQGQYPRVLYGKHARARKLNGVQSESNSCRQLQQADVIIASHPYGWTKQTENCLLGPLRDVCLHCGLARQRSQVKFGKP